MRVVLVLAAAMLAGVTALAQTPAVEPVTFTHQIRQFLMKGDDTDKIDMSATFTADGVVFTPKKKGRDPVSIAYEAMTSMVYDRRSRVRKMASSWGKAEDHFLTIQYKTPAGVGDFIEVEMGKDTAPRMLATLEARSGKKIDRASGS
jgi:hypothetical protein